MRTYAIGDIHGRLDQLEAAHRLIEEDRRRIGDEDAPVIHLGDLVDRGPDSAAVIARLVEGRDAGRPWQVLKGNHDRMFTGFLGDPAHHDPCLRPDLEWLNPRLGGGTTLESYGVDASGGRETGAIHLDAVRLVPASHREFLSGLPGWIERGGIAFVHAGIRPGILLAQQTEDDLTWIRVPFLEDPRDHGVLVVHGHTALDQATHHGNRVNLDSGAGYGRATSTAVFEGRDVWLLTDAGRQPLLPVAQGSL